MLHVLALLTLLVAAMDHWTTWRCLRAPVDGWMVSEANPISDWLFGQMGLVPGLLLDSVLTVVAVGFLITTPMLPRTTKAVVFCTIIAWTGYAVVNNFQAIHTMGITLI